MSENVEFEESVSVVEMSVVEAQDRAAIDIQISTANKYPRNVQRAINDSIAIVTLDTETAQTCHYSVPRGGKVISGGSVHLAKILAQNWGNLRIEAKVVNIDDKHVTSQAVCFDLQKNLAIKVEVKRSIVGRTGRFSDDMVTVTGNASNSIALRNAIFAVIPKGVVDKVYRAAKEKISGDVSTEAKLIGRRKQVFDQLQGSYSVNEKEILSAIGKQSINHVTAEDIITLIGAAQAVKDGDTTIDEVFRGKGKYNQPAPAKSSEQSEGERMLTLINEAPTIEKLNEYKPHVKPEQMQAWETKFAELSKTQEPDLFAGGKGDGGKKTNNKKQ